jgi:hypothetical protein
VWGLAADITLYPIFKLQKRAIRLIGNLRRRDSTQSTFKKYGILRLPDIYTFSTIIFMFKFKNGLLPPIFEKFYLENANFHRYPTRQANYLRSPKFRTNISKCFIKTSGVRLWNEYSQLLSQTTKIKPLKKELIALLIDKYGT